MAMKAAAKPTTKTARTRVPTRKETTPATTRARARKEAAPVAPSRIISLRTNGQVTITAEIRAQAHARAGDLFVAEVTDDASVLRRKHLIDANQAYFWTEEWQRGEREATEDITHGRYKSFRSARALIADLRG